MNTFLLQHFFYKFCINIIAIGITGALFKHIEVTSFSAVVFASLLLTILNYSIKPILVFISLPVVIFTMGIGYLIVNALILLLVSSFISGYHIDGFWTAFGAGLMVSFINMIFDAFSSVKIRRF